MLRAVSFSVVLTLAAATSLGCGNAPPANAPSPMASASATAAATPLPPQPTTPSSPPAEPTKEEAHRFLMEGVACWLGGLWSDAEGESGDMKKAAIEGRCNDVVRRVYGGDETAKLEAFRALEPPAVGDFAARVQTLAGNDTVDGPRKENLGKLAIMVGDAEREAMHARRAADKVKQNEDGKEPEKLGEDEVKAVAPLRAHAALDALLALDVGDLSKEAHALGVLAVMQRVNIARGLPKHLKMYAWGDALKSLFGVPLPDMPSDATKKLTKGQLLSYLIDVAKAAGHGVPDKVALSPDAKAKYTLAYAGVLEGIADKLKADLDGISEGTELHKVATAVKSRLEAEYSAERTALLSSGEIISRT